MYLVRTGSERRFLGVIVAATAEIYQVVNQRGAQQLLRHRVNGREFVRAAREQIVQRYVWRNINTVEANILTKKGERVEPDAMPALPPRPMSPQAPRGLLGKTAKSPYEHVMIAKMASKFSSATTIERGQIVNRGTGQEFNVSGTIKIDLFRIDPSRIVVLSSASGRRAWGLADTVPQAELDTMATREVLIEGGIPIGTYTREGR